MTTGASPRLSWAERRARSERFQHDSAARSIRLELFQILDGTRRLDALDDARTAIAWIASAGADLAAVRLDCLRTIATNAHHTIDVEALIARAETLLAFVTEADNG